MNLARFGVTKPVPVNLLMVAAIVAGLFSAFTLTREFFPNVTPEAVSVLLVYPGATPEEIEESMARKVEDKLADLDEVDRIVTTLSEGGGGIMAELRQGVNVDLALDEIERAIDTLTDLPEDAEEIQTSLVEPRMPVIMVSVFGDAEEETLKETIRHMRDELESLPGMGELLIAGVREYEIRIDVNYDALIEHGISLPMVSNRIREWMADVPGGSVRTNVGNINVRTMGVAEQADTIRNIVVKATPNGQALRVADIADVREYYVDEQTSSRFTTQELSGRSATLVAFKVGDQDAVKIAEMVRGYVKGRKGEPLDAKPTDLLRNPGVKTAYELGQSSPYPIPAGCDVALHSDLARFIEGRLDLLMRNARAGAMLVFLTLLIFLNWRVAWWVFVGLLTALCGTLVLMAWFGITLNLLTSFGLIVVLGLLVDDAIVVAENIQARHDRGEASLSAAIAGTNEVLWPVVATVLTSIVAFLPLMFIRGTIGDLMAALPIVVTCALLMSLVEAILILPSHLGHSLVKRDKRRPGRIAGFLHRFESGRDRMIFGNIIPAYARFMQVSLKYRYISAAVAFGLVIISIGMIVGGRMNFTFLPKSDAETIVVDMRMPIGTPLEQTEWVVHKIEEAARNQPEVKAVSSVVGQKSNLDTGLSDVSATHVAQMFVELLPVELRDRQSQDVIVSIRNGVQDVPGIESISFSEIQGGPSGASITIIVKGPNLDQIDEAAEQIKHRLAEFAGVFDIADDNYEGQREVQISLTPGAAASGFTVNDVAQQVRGALFGLEAHVYSAKREDIKVRVRLDENSRQDLNAIENLWVIGPEGQAVPLGEIAVLDEGASFVTIRRVDRKRAVTVTADTAPSANPEEIVPELSGLFTSLKQQYPGLDIELAGRQREMARAFDTLPLGFLAALIMIYVILAWLFHNYAQPLVVMMGIPFSIIGVVWGHYITGYDMTFLSLIGFVAVSGIVVNDSLILVEFFNVKRREGLSVRDALIDAGRARLRAIFLTTITTVLGLTPLMLEQSFQAKFLIPMAISIAFGLMSATLLILVVLPCFMVIFDDIKRASYYIWHGRPLSETAEMPTIEALETGE